MAARVKSRSSWAGSVVESWRQVKDQAFGARFHIMDLHFHTPASSDARGSNRYDFNPFDDIEYRYDISDPWERQRAHRAEQAIWLEKAHVQAMEIAKALIAKNISVIAITDHNALGTVWPAPREGEGNAGGGSMDLTAPTWYELIDTAAEELSPAGGPRRLTVLAGVEISTSGVHILAVFPPTKPRRRVHIVISDLLISVGIGVEDFGSNPRVGHASPQDTLEQIRRRGGLAIIAHIDGSDQSILKLYGLESGAMKNVLTSEHLTAVEVVDADWMSRRMGEKGSSSDDDGDGPGGQDGAANEAQKSRKKPQGADAEPLERGQWIHRVRSEASADLGQLAVVQGSDAHCIADMAQRFTRAKMTRPGFDGVRAALSNPRSRLRLSSEGEPSNEGLYLYGVEIDSDELGGKASIRFNRHLNCIVGHKECGKSRLFELMRKAMEGDAASEARGKVRLFVQRRTPLPATSTGTSTTETGQAVATASPAVRLGVEQSTPAQEARPSMEAKPVRRLGKTPRATTEPTRYEETTFCVELNADGRRTLSRLQGAQETLEAQSLAGNPSDWDGLRVRFFDGGRVREIIDDDGKLQAFLKKHLGEPDAANVAARNEAFAPKAFLSNEVSPLLQFKASGGRWDVQMNVQWRQSKKPDLLPFSELTLSLRRVALIAVLILSDKAGPLLIDEPGDYFNNEDIANFLVPLIRQFKDERQMILATSNSNLAINADPDNYVLIETDVTGKVTDIRSGFALESDEERTKMVALMEGSLSAYRARGARYQPT